jgi:hypothetical protein
MFILGSCKHDRCGTGVVGENIEYLAMVLVVYLRWWIEIERDVNVFFFTED